MMLSTLKIKLKLGLYLRTEDYHKNLKRNSEMSNNPQKQKQALEIDVKSIDMTDEMIVRKICCNLMILGKNPKVHHGSVCQQQHRGGHRPVLENGARQKRESRMECDCRERL